VFCLKRENRLLERMYVFFYFLLPGFILILMAVLKEDWLRKDWNLEQVFLAEKR